PARLQIDAADPVCIEVNVLRPKRDQLRESTGTRRERNAGRNRCDHEQNENHWQSPHRASLVLFVSLVTIMTDVDAPWTSGRGASRPSAVGLDVAARIGQERLIDAERPGDLHL